MINNSVKDGYNKIIGFRCLECESVVPGMWGNICNKCTAERKRFQQFQQLFKKAEQKQVTNENI